MDKNQSLLMYLTHSELQLEFVAVFSGERRNELLLKTITFRKYTKINFILKNMKKHIDLT